MGSLELPLISKRTLREQDPQGSTTDVGNDLDVSKDTISPSLDIEQPVCANSNESMK